MWASLYHRRATGSHINHYFRVLPRIILTFQAYVQCCRAFSSSRDLSKIYREIAERSNRLQRWPESKKFCDDCLVFDPKSESYCLPTFDDGHGSLGVFGFLHRSNQSRSIMTVCDAVFETFCSDIYDKILTNDVEQQAAMDHWILQSPSSSHHISVAILQEHPIFLRNDKDIEAWQPISDTTIQHLASSFAQDLPSLLSKCPTLQLDSLLWTPDGALIAGFVDSSSDEDFEKLRQTSRDIARDILGDLLTTRPKNLIHATVGRIIGLPPRATDEQYQALTNLALEYNENVLPRTVEQIQATTKSSGTFNLEELSLARNIVWMMKEYKEYASWSLIS